MMSKAKNSARTAFSNSCLMVTTCLFTSVLQILQLAVLSILLTAPAGAAVISLIGPLTLHRSASLDRLQRKSEVNVEDIEAMPTPRETGDSVVEDGIEVTDRGRISSLQSVDKRKVFGESQGEQEEMDSAVDSVDTSL